MRAAAEKQTQSRPDEVAAVIDRLLWATSASRVILHDVDPAIEIALENGRSLAGFRLMSVQPGTDGLIANVERMLPQYAQQPATSTEIAVPATPEIVSEQGPSLVALYFGEGEQARRQAFEALAGDAAALAQIRDVYGLLPANEARTIASSSLVDGFKSVSVLGFRVSPRRLPALIFGLNVVVLAILLGAVEAARRRGATPADGRSENPLELCAQNRPVRWVLWVVMPAASVSLANAGGNESLLLIVAGSIVLVMLGALAAIRAGSMPERT